MKARPATGVTTDAKALEVGCCGFAESQASYFRHFRLVEVQQTFYEPPRVSTAQRWRLNAPSDFEFTLKAWQLITHEATSPTYRRLRTPIGDSAVGKVGSFRPRAEVWNAWERTWEIAATLSARAVVFQCPPSFIPTPENKQNLRQFFARVRERLRPNASPLLGWEPRGNWSDAEVRDLCRELELVHVVDPFSRMPVTRGLFYFRLHGIGGYSHRYSDGQLLELLNIARRLGSDGYCLFNNVSMREDAARLAHLCSRRTKSSRPNAEPAYVSRARSTLQNEINNFESRGRDDRFVG